jgi:hypothetical protein
MAKPAGGKHPPNVTAVIISEDERRAKLAEAPPGGGGTGPGATVSTHYVPSVDEQHAQEMADQLVGRAALLCAKKLGVPYVWSTQTKKKITIESAETLCRKHPGLVYFDFDALEEIAANLENEEAQLKAEDESALEGDPYIEQDEERIADIADPAVMAELEATAELEIDPDKEVSDDERLARAREEAIQETALDQTPPAHVISETERRAWGATLSTPGMQVYIHPHGITRVDVQGRVKLQTGKQGNVRMFRIQALEPPKMGGEVRKVTYTTVTGPKAPAQPPKSTTRRMQDDRIPIPIPPEIDHAAETDY